MKKRTAIIGALVSLLPIGQPLVIGTGSVLISSALLLSVPERAQAESALFYYNRGKEKYRQKDYYGAISALNKGIKINPNYKLYLYRGMSKGRINDFYGSISDFNKGLKLKPNEGLLFIARSAVKIKLGDMKSGCSDLKQAIDLGHTFLQNDYFKFCE